MSITDKALDALDAAVNTALDALCNPWWHAKVWPVLCALIGATLIAAHA